MSPNRPPTEAQILRQLEEVLSRALPPGWSSRLERDPRAHRSRADGILRLESPDGESVGFLIEVKRSSTPQSVGQAIDQLTAYSKQTTSTELLPLIASSYLSPRSKEILAERNISYADSTGNLRVAAQRPGLFVERAGATKDPWPDDRPLQSVKGRGAGRAVRALVDFQPPYGVRDLAQRAAVSPATLSRVIDLLEREALLTRNEQGGVSELDWAGIIRRWTQDYDVRRSNDVATYLEPRGLTALAGKLRDARWRYAVTGSLGAQGYAPIAPARVATVYVEDAQQAAGRLQLRPADAGINVLLAEPFDDVVFSRTRVRDRLVTVAPTQLAADLLTGPGREPSEGEELLAWMERNVDDWRS